MHEENFFSQFFCWHLTWYIIYLTFNTECLASYIYLSISSSDGTWKLLIGSLASGFITLLSIYSDLVCARPQPGCFILSPHETFIIVMMMMLYFTGLWASLAPPRLIVAGSHNFIERLKENRSDWRKFSGIKMIIIVTTNRVHRAPVIVK